MNEKSESEQAPVSVAILWNIRRAVLESRDLKQAQFHFRGFQHRNGMGTTESDFEALKIEFNKVKKVNG